MIPCTKQSGNDPTAGIWWKHEPDSALLKLREYLQRLKMVKADWQTQSLTEPDRNKYFWNGNVVSGGVGGLMGDLVHWTGLFPWASGIRWQQQMNQILTNLYCFSFTVCEASAITHPGPSKVLSGRRHVLASCSASLALIFEYVTEQCILVSQ